MEGTDAARADAGVFQFDVGMPRKDSTQASLARARLDEQTELAKLNAASYRYRRQQLESEAWPVLTRRVGTPSSNGQQSADLEESFAFDDGNFASLWADYFDLHGPSSWYSFGPGTTTRRHGVNWPFFRSEQELNWFRAASRFVVTRNPHAAGIVGGASSYVVFKGMECQATPADKTSDPADARLCRLVERELDHWYELVESDIDLSWLELQSQIFAETLMDGEYFLQDFDLGDHLLVRGVLPELIKQPPGAPFDEWGFGVQSPPDDQWKALAYHVGSWDSENDGHIVPADSMTRFMLKLPGRWSKGVKRAMPLFSFGVKDAFDHAGKLLRNMGIGVTIRQGWAAVRQWDGVPRETATGFASTNADYQQTRNVAGNAQTQNVRIQQAGTVLDAPQGMSFGTLPSSPETSAAIEVVDALLRNAVAILNAPEWLVSGNARNMGAYASSMVAESPFVKVSGMLQEYFGRRFLRILKKVIAVAVRCGRLPPEVMHRVKLTMVHPTLETRDKDKESSRFTSLIGAGIMSRQEAAAQLDLDYDKQFAENVEFQTKTLEAQIKLAKLQQELAALQQPPPGDGGGGAPSGEGPPGPGDSGGDGSDSGAPPSPSLPGAEVGGDEAGTDLSPFGDIGESLADGQLLVAEMTESIEAALLEGGFTGVIRDKIGRTYHYQDGKRIAAAKAKEAGIDSESHPIKDAGKARAALKVVLDRGDVSEQHLADIAEHLPAMSVKDLRLMKAALMDRVAAKDKEALIGRVREAAQRRVAESGANEQREVPPVDPQASEEPQQPVAGEPTPTPTEQPPTNSQTPQEPTHAKADTQPAAVKYDTKLNPGEAGQLKSWEGDRGKVAMDAAAKLAKGNPGAVVRDGNGEVVGIMSFVRGDGTLDLDHLATKRGGLGKQMLGELARQAASEGLGVSLIPTEGSRAFYEKMGMKWDEPSFVFDAKAAAAFAKANAGAKTGTNAAAQSAPDTAAPQSDPASSIRAVYDSADDLTQDSGSIDAKLAVMDKLDKKSLLGVAEKMELVGMQHKSLAAIRGAIRQKIADRRGQAQRRAMLDDGPSTDPNLGIDDEAASPKASPTATPQATPAKPAAPSPAAAPASPVAAINANVLNPHVTDAQFTKQVADAVVGMNKSQMQAAYKELGYAAPLSGTPEQMKTKLSAAMTARRDQRLRAADGFAPDWSVHQAAAQVRSGEATPEQAAARLSRDIMGQGGDAHVIQLLKEFGIKTPGDLGTKAGKQAAADAIAKAAVAKASEPPPAFAPASREAAPKPTAIDPARYVPPVNRDAVAGVKARQRGPAKSHTVDSATKTAKQLFDAALASDWDEAKVQAEVDGLASLSIGDLNAVWKNLGGSATHANRESALKAIENLIVDRRGKHLRSKV